MIRSFGGDTIDRMSFETAEGVLNGDAAVAWGDWFQGLFDMGYATATPVDPDADFKEGRVALSWVGHWMYNDYNEALGDDLVLIPVPDFGAGAVTGMGSWNWGITSSCENPDGAWAFIEFLMSPENTASMANSNGAIPSVSQHLMLMNAIKKVATFTSIVNNLKVVSLYLALKLLFIQPFQQQWKTQ